MRVYILTGLAIFTLAGCLSVLPKPQAAPQPTGAQDFAQYCAACHGVGGRGDGPNAVGLPNPPADLTTIAARRQSQIFPLAQVMTKINGYILRDTADTMMPEFGDLLDSPVVLVDTGDGIPTPTPERLLNLAEYLRALQVGGA